MNKPNWLYIGNKLYKHGYTPTSLETLGDQLANDINLKRISSLSFPLLRLLDMWWSVWHSKGKVKGVLIDTYSTNAFHYAWTSALLCRFRGLEYYPILHGGNLPMRFERSFAISRKYLKYAKAIISPSPYLQDVVERIFNFKTILIPNSIDLNDYPLIEKAKDQPKLFWLRAFHKIYHPELAVQVLHLLHKKGYSNAELCMIGPEKDGSLLEVHRLIRELKLENSVYIHGRLDKKDWIRLSTSSNIFLNTSNIDNMPVSIMEAMALGLPVVSTKAGGIPWLLQEEKEGILVETGQAKEMADAVIRLIQNDKFYRNISKAAREKATQWDWETVGVKWKEILLS